MTSKREILNNGRFPIPDPPEVTPENEQYGQVYDELINDADGGGGQFGDFFAHLPRTETGISVVANVATLTRRGPVLIVQTTAGNFVGVATQRITGLPASTEVLVTYDADGIPTLEFLGADAITQCSVLQLSPPADIDAMLSVDLPDP